MTKSKKSASPAKDEDALERIARAMQKLAAEVEVLRARIDKLQDNLVWVLNNDDLRGVEPRRASGSPMHITSMPRNPLAADFGKRLNRFRPEDLPTEAEPDEELSAFQQQDLFS